MEWGALNIKLTTGKNCAGYEPTSPHPCKIGIKDQTYPYAKSHEQRVHMAYSKCLGMFPTK